jgi:hypothetical protein
MQFLQIPARRDQVVSRREAFPADTDKLLERVSVISALFESKLIEFVKFFSFANKNILSIKKLKGFCRCLSSIEMLRYKDLYKPLRIELNSKLVELICETFNDLFKFLNKVHCDVISLEYISGSEIDLSLVSETIELHLPPPEKRYLSHFRSTYLVCSTMSMRRLNPVYDLFFKIIVTDPFQQSVQIAPNPENLEIKSECKPFQNKALRCFRATVKNPHLLFLTY